MYSIGISLTIHRSLVGGPTHQRQLTALDQLAMYCPNLFTSDMMYPQHPVTVGGRIVSRPTVAIFYRMLTHPIIRSILDRHGKLAVYMENMVIQVPFLLSYPILLSLLVY